ncbi:hypothetical protein C8R43DRAFT_1122079 [Mycena crocata]|nr:hypothetical protein C8R43DRAFT_1122079 [Mycena crocata]
MTTWGPRSSVHEASMAIRRFFIARILHAFGYILIFNPRLTSLSWLPKQHYCNMFTNILLLTLIFPLIRAAATLKPGVYHVVNLGHPYAPASFNKKNRVILPEDFSGNYDLWEVVSGRPDGITIQNLRGKKYARISPPAEGRFVSTGAHPTAFSTVLSGTADFPGDDVFIPDTYLDYWTIATPSGLVWTYDNAAGPEVSLHPLNANRTAGQYWLFAAEGSLPFLPRDLNDTMKAILSPRLTFPSL